MVRVLLAFLIPFFHLTSTANATLPEGYWIADGTLKAHVHVKAYAGFKIADEQEDSLIFFKGLVYVDAQGVAEMVVCRASLEGKKLVVVFREDSLPLAETKNIAFNEPFETLIDDKIADADVYVKGHHRVWIHGQFRLGMTFNPQVLSPTGYIAYMDKVTLVSNPVIEGLPWPISATVDIRARNLQADPHFVEFYPTASQTCVDILD